MKHKMRIWLLAIASFTAIACVSKPLDYELCDDVNVMCPDETANNIVVE